jgi:hypothetical protein
MDTSDTDNAWQNHNASNARFGGGVLRIMVLEIEPRLARSA